MPKTEREAYIAFSAFPQIGPQRFKLLKKYFGTARVAWKANISEYIKIGFSNKLANSFQDFRQEFNLDSYLHLLKQYNIGTITIEDKYYPKRLKNIDDSPFLLYIKGADAAKKLKQWELAIAVVGTRRMTSYGHEITERLVTHLVDNGITIISGLALGIDATAHKSALMANGTTIGVLGGGLDKIYPPANSRLAEEMLKSGKGILVSEYPLGYPSMPQNFPHRNRIVSGLSLGVLVIEGAEKSGTLLTASSAANQGKDVFAVPGPITSHMSKAPNFLLKNGAKLVESAEDILEELDIDAKRKAQNAKRALPETKEEKEILDTLTGQSMDIDSIIRLTGLDSGAVLSTLTSMELKGLVRNIGGVYHANTSE